MLFCFLQAVCDKVLPRSDRRSESIRSNVPSNCSNLTDVDPRIPVKTATNLEKESPPRNKEVRIVIGSETASTVDHTGKELDKPNANDLATADGLKISGVYSLARQESTVKENLKNNAKVLTITPCVPADQANYMDNLRGMTDINAQRGQRSDQMTDVISKVAGVECVGVLRCPRCLGVPSVPTRNQTVYAFNSPSFASHLEHLIANDGYEIVSDSVEKLATLTDQTPVRSQPCTSDEHLTGPEQQLTAKYNPSPSEQLAPFEETFHVEQAKIRCDYDQVNEPNSSEKSSSLNQNDETTKSVPVENHKYLPVMGVHY